MEEHTTKLSDLVSGWTAELIKNGDVPVKFVWQTSVSVARDPRALEPEQDTVRIGGNYIEVSCNAHKFDFTPPPFDPEFTLSHMDIIDGVLYIFMREAMDGW